MLREVGYSYKDLEKIAKLDIHTGLHSIGYKAGGAIAFVGSTEDKSFTLLKGTYLRSHVILVLDNSKKAVYMYQAGVNVEILKLIDGVLDNREFIEPSYSGSKPGINDIKGKSEEVMYYDFNTMLADVLYERGLIANTIKFKLTEYPHTTYAVLLQTFIDENIDEIIFETYKRVLAL